MYLPSLPHQSHVHFPIQIFPGMRRVNPSAQKTEKKNLQREAHVASRQEKSKMVMLMAGGWWLPFWSCQQTSSSTQAGGFYSQAVHTQCALRTLEAESENSCLFCPFPAQAIKWKIILLGCAQPSILPNTNFYKCTIPPVSQPLTLVRTWHLKRRLQPYPPSISLTVAALQWIILFHVLKQDSKICGTTKMLAMLIKLWNPL